MALSFCPSANMFQHYFHIVSLDFLNDGVPSMSSEVIKFSYLVIFQGFCRSNLSKPSLINSLQPLSWQPYLFLYMAVDSEYQNYKFLYPAAYENLLLLFFAILFLQIFLLYLLDHFHTASFSVFGISASEIFWLTNFFIMSCLGCLSSFFGEDGVLGVYFYNSFFLQCLYPSDYHKYPSFLLLSFVASHCFP